VIEAISFVSTKHCAALDSLKSIGRFVNCPISR